MRRRDKIFQIIIDNFNPLKGYCSLTNKEFIANLKLVEIDEGKTRVITPQGIASLLKTLERKEKIYLIYKSRARHICLSMSQKQALSYYENNSK